MCQIQIGHIPCSALIDTGADISVMSLNMLKKLQLQMRVTMRPIRSRNVFSVSGQDLKLLGEIDLILTVAGKKCPAKITILEKSSQDLILGTDFIHRHGVNVLHREGLLSVKEVTKMLSKRSVLLQPGTQHTIQLKAAKHIAPGRIGLIGSHPNLDKKELLGRTTLTKAPDSQQKWAYKIVNLTPKPKWLKRNAVVGRFEPLDSDVIIEDLGEEEMLMTQTSRIGTIRNTKKDARPKSQQSRQVYLHQG